VDTREASGQCPPGKILAKAYFSNGPCNYTVIFCYDCPPTHLDSTEAEILSIFTTSSNLTNCRLIDSTVRNLALKAIAQKLMIECGTYPPCDPGPSTPNLHIKFSACAYYKNTFIDNGGGDIYYVWELIYCDGPHCVREYKSCWDYTTIPPTLNTPYEVVQIGTFEKCGVEPILPGPYDPIWNTNWETDCFLMNPGSPCGD